MRATCSICGQIIVSLIVDPELAARNFLDKVNGHYLKVHNKEFQEIQREALIAIGALSCAFMVQQCLEVPDDSLRLIEAIGNWERVVMGAIGYDPEENGEETESDDSENGADDSNFGETSDSEPPETDPMVVENGPDAAD